MPGKCPSKRLLTAGLLMLAGCGMDTIVQAAQAPPSGFEVTSTTFADGGPLPVRTAYTLGPNFPNCVGQNISPALAWSKPPQGTKSYAVTMLDLENMVGDIGLVVYGIPPEVTSFGEGEFNKASPKFISGVGSRDNQFWRGMCPPPGTAPHHYVFLVMATDLDPKALPPGLAWLELDGRLRKGHLIDSQAIVGTFKRP